jgi:hypothetical protein
MDTTTTTTSNNKDEFMAKWRAAREEQGLHVVPPIPPAPAFPYKEEVGTAAAQEGLPEGQLSIEPFKSPHHWGVRRLVFTYNDGVKVIVTLPTTALNEVTEDTASLLSKSDHPLASKLKDGRLTAWEVEGSAKYYIKGLEGLGLKSNPQGPVRCVSNHALQSCFAIMLCNHQVTPNHFSTLDHTPNNIRANAHRLIVTIGNSI